MKQARFGHLLASLGLATLGLALVLGALSLFTHTSYAAALPQTNAPSLPEVRTLAPPPIERPAQSAGVIVQASAVPSISNIIGATYNEGRGKIIVFGITDPDLPPLSFSYVRENLVIALRAYYDANGPETPGVSIEGTLDPLSVVYFGTVTNTHFGQVSFETDRLLKIYTMGVDNLTGITVTSGVTGYMGYPNRMSQQTETVTEPILIRYFFTPTLTIESIPSPHTIIFSRTQKFVDWAYMSATTSTATAAAAQGFVDDFNQYYWDYAAERRAAKGDTTLYEMAQLSKLAAIAEWALDQGLDLKLPGLNDPWLSRYPVTYTVTVTQTPGITVTWVQTISGQAYTSSLRGGVYAVGDIDWIPATAAGQTLAYDVLGAIQTPHPPPMMAIVQPNQVRPCDEIYAAGGACSGGSCSEGPLVAYVVPLAANAVVNGDFEDGPHSPPWQQNSPYEIIADDQPYNGTYGAWLAGYPNAYDVLSQSLYIPADATLARLTYWRAVATDESTHPHDFFASFLANGPGNRLATFEELDDGDADGFWHQVSFDVGAYAGQAVQLWFTATTNATNDTNFFVDDVSLDYMDLTPPAVVTVTAASSVTQTGSIEVAIDFRERMKTSVMPTVTVHLTGSQTSYTFTAKTGAGYTNGYLDSDPARWYGLCDFTPWMTSGNYALDVSAAQDVAGNVMYTADNVHTLTFSSTTTLSRTFLPVMLRSFGR